MFLTFDYTLQVFTDKGTGKCYKYVQIINTKNRYISQGHVYHKKVKIQYGL